MINKTRLNIVTLELATNCKKNGELRVLTGQQVCIHCFQFIDDLIASAINVEFISNNFIEDIEVRVLKDRFVAAKTIKGTLGFNSFTPIPGSFCVIKVKQYNMSTTQKTVKVAKWF